MCIRDRILQIGELETDKAKMPKKITTIYFLIRCPQNLNQNNISFFIESIGLMNMHHYSMEN